MAPPSSRSGINPIANTSRSAPNRPAPAPPPTPPSNRSTGPKPITSTPIISASKPSIASCPIPISTPSTSPTPSANPPIPKSLAAFVKNHPELVGEISIPGIDRTITTTAADVERIAGKFLLAVQEAGKIYRHIAELKGEGNFITEVSMDETDQPQTPPELLVILAALADEKIPLQTIAPKFTGRFNKGVDYVGDLAQFEKEFSDDLAVIAFAIKQYGLPANLKLSVHSGSDKFSIYAPIRRAIAKHGAGLHIKTAGTTWLEELIGLAEGGRRRLETRQRNLRRRARSCRRALRSLRLGHRHRSRQTSLRIRSQCLERNQFVSALRHDQKNPAFNPHLRQLLHVGYKIAAKLGPRYLDALGQCESSVSKNVTENLYERHLKPLFLNYNGHAG